MSESKGDDRLERLLVERGKLASSDLQRVRQHPERREGLGRVLEALGILSEEDFLGFMAEVNGTERVALGGLALDWAMAESLSFELCLEHCAVPVRLEGRTVVVAMADPGDLASLDTIRFRLGTRVRPVVAAEHEIRDGIRRLFPEQAARLLALEDAVVHEAQTRGIAPVPDQRPEVEARLRQAYFTYLSAAGQGQGGGFDATIAPGLAHELLAAVRLVNEAMLVAVAEGASHLRLDLFPDQVALLFRKGQVWGAPQTLPEALSLWVVWHVKTLCGFPVGPLSRPVQALLPLPDASGQTHWFRVFVVPARDGHRVLGSPLAGQIDLSAEVMWEPENPTLKPWWERLQEGVEALAAGRIEAAQECFVAAAEKAEDLGAVGRVPLAETLSHLARAIEITGRNDDACALYTRALAVKEAAVGSDSPLLVPLLSDLGEALLRLGNLPDALAQLRRAVSLLEVAFGPEDLEVAWLLERIGHASAAQGRTQEAMDCMSEADALASRLLEGDPASA